MKPKPILALIFLAAFHSSVMAQTRTGVAASQGHSGIRQSYVECTRKHEGATLEIGYCISEEKKYQDKRLNENYQALTKALSTSQKQTLIAAQRAWLAYHAKEGVLQGSLYGSDQASNLQIGEYTLYRLSERADQLKKYLDLIRD
ncbi:lysozyme inhibitor LprI family protein [Lysobacter sp. TAB13]